MRIYHITSSDAAQDAVKTGTYVPPAFGHDGFVHCSYLHQIEGVANRRFRARRDLVLLEIERSRLPCEVRDEDLAGEGEAYPHVYGHIPMRAVVREHLFSCGDDGSFERPASLDPGSRTSFFLPGASGDVSMWRPVADRLGSRAARTFMTWPGFGGAPGDADVRGIDDLVERVAASIDAPCDLFAQSMGGVVAMRAALKRPEHVRHLVLAVTSGGLDVAALGGIDWRPMFLALNPGVPRWFIDARDDLTTQFARLSLPVLLLWGDTDPISPVAVGRALAAALPNATLVVVKGGTHDLVRERADDVFPHIERHLAI